jgi:hypothetical protein
MKSLNDIKKLVTKLKVKPTSEMKSKVLDEALKLQRNQNQQTTSDTNTWRIIMKNRMTKLAAVAVIAVAILVFMQIPSRFVSTAYALQDTIEACNSIQWLHIYESETVFQETRTSEFWLGCDEQGNVTKMRFQSDNIGEPIGSLTVALNSGESEAWIPKYNLQMVGCGGRNILLRYDISELDPKYFFERLLEQELRGEVIVEIKDPLKKREPVVVIVTYPPGSRSENYKKVFYIDQATKLVTKIDKFEQRDHEFQHVKTLEFFDYNQPIDQMMFTLDGEVPADVKVIDMSDVEVGLSQGDMTNEEIATKVTLQFVEALKAKNFYKAGQLFLGAPAFLIKKTASVNILKIISVGPVHPDPDPDSNAMISSCKLLGEIGGKYYEINAWMVRVIRASKDSDRWLIGGMAQSVNPVSEAMSLENN